MATWLDIAKSSYRAARVLEDTHADRSAVSRYYYAAFSAVADALRPHIGLAPQRETPPHRDIPTLIERHLRALSTGNRRKLKSAMRTLYGARLAADYRSRITTDAASAVASRRETIMVFQILRVQL